MGVESRENCDHEVISDYIVNHRQRFTTGPLAKEFYEILSSENLENSKAAKDPLSRKLLLSIRKTGKLNFNISSHEVFHYQTIKNPEKLLQYLTFRYKFSLASKERRAFDAPPYLLLEPTSVCNLRCPMCFQIDKTFTRRPYMGTMQWDLFTRLVDEADEIGVGAITLASRGEPTMHRKFGEMLCYIGDKKNIFELKTNTNATYLTEVICHQIFQGGVTTVVVSADHYKKQPFEKLRKGAKFEKVISNVKMLHSIREKQYPSCKTEIRVSGVDFYNKLDRKKFTEFWSSCCDSVTCSSAVERWDTYNNEPHHELSSPCSFLWDRMYVWFDGTCNPCDEDYKSYLSYGNVNDKTLKEVWNGTRLRELREIHKNKKRNSIIPCDRCGLDFH